MSDIRDDVLYDFEAVFGRPAAGVWSAPGRLTLLGTPDSPETDAELAIAINRRTVLAAGPSPDRTVRIASALVDEMVTVELDELATTAVEGWSRSALAIVQEVMASSADSSALSGVDVFIDTTIPVGAGMGSSSALEAALALALTDLWSLGEHIAHLPEHPDVAASVFALDDHALVRLEGETRPEPLPLDWKTAGLELLVIDTDAPTADELDAAIADDEVRRTLHTITENQRVRDAALAIRDETPRLLGALLDASQASLRDDYGISTTEIDLAVETALASGALGARMLGRPFSGVAVALVDTDTASRVRVALDGAFAEHALGQPTVTEVLPSLGALRDR
ncbi:MULTISPECIES: galactokinase family protein [unclassified Salinibacterium]|uniref:galactokinase n=1 Tax=unclassified Salinibacterium TaxID=2632331 RepID=UPI0018CED059|nr:MULTISPECIES: galactokinase family protein [unclassified Salinibacterium]MBH0053409.1 galactokinase [Salinibacterium sp. SWN139]MBH0082677.1 galactokinase [Salinibacterium sp. SWN167]